MHKELHFIEETLKHHSAQSYYRQLYDRAEEKYSDKINHYLQTAFGDGNTGTKTCMDRFKTSSYNRYAEMIKLYNGWIKNGRVFILDKEQRHIYFLYKSDNLTANIYTHYNPFNYDCIEAGIKASHFNTEIRNERYDISQDDELLIKELHELP